MTISLEKWIYTSPTRKKIYVDVDSMRPFYSMEGAIPDYRALSEYIKEKQGKNVIPSFYFSHHSSKLFVKRKDGFILKSGLQIGDRLKCSELNLAVDLLHDAHEGKFDKAILIGGNIEKYRTALDYLEQLGKPVREVSLKKLMLEGNKIELLVKKTGMSKKKEVSKQAWNDDRFDYRLMASDQSDLRNKVSKARKTKRCDKKTILYVDHGNVFHRIQAINRKNGLKADLDEVSVFSRLQKRAKSRNELITANMFLGFPEFSNDMLVELGKQILQLTCELKELGYEIHMSLNQNQFKGGMKEVSVDLEMGIRVMIDALEGNCEKTILVTGDADFVPVIKKLKKLHHDYEVWCFRNALSGELFKATGTQDRLLFLDDLF